MKPNQLTCHLLVSVITTTNLLTQNIYAAEHTVGSDEQNVRHTALVERSSLGSQRSKNRPTSVMKYIPGTKTSLAIGAAALYFAGGSSGISADTISSIVPGLPLQLAGREEFSCLAVAMGSQFLTHPIQRYGVVTLSCFAHKSLADRVRSCTQIDGTTPDSCAPTLLDSKLEKGAEEFSSQFIKSLNTDVVKEMAEVIDRYKTILEDVKDQDITVLLGITGDGKSTIGNAFGEKQMRFSVDGDLELAEGVNGFRVMAGGSSVTSHPESITANELGILFDLPGFEDTNGTIKDLVNAALMKQLLENARSVKVVLTISEGSIESGGRARALKSIMRYIQMFDKRFLEESVMLLINKATQKAPDKWLRKYLTPATQLAEELLRKGRVQTLPKIVEETDLSQLYDAAKKNKKGIKALKETKTGEVNISMSFNTETQVELARFFQLQMFTQLQEVIATEWPRQLQSLGGRSSAFRENKAAILKSFTEIVDKNQVIRLLRPLGKSQYQVVFDELVRESGAFDAEFKTYVSNLEVLEAKAAEAASKKTELEAIKIAEEQKRIAEQERKKTEEAKIRGDAKAAEAAKAKEAAALANARAEAAEAEAAKAPKVVEIHHHHGGGGGCTVM